MAPFLLPTSLLLSPLARITATFEFWPLFFIWTAHLVQFHDCIVYGCGAITFKTSVHRQTDRQTDGWTYKQFVNYSKLLLSLFPITEGVTGTTLCDHTQTLRHRKYHQLTLLQFHIVLY